MSGGNRNNHYVPRYDGGNNNGTMDAFNNQGTEQDFNEAEFTTGGQITGGYSTYNYHNNGTRNAFNNNSSGGKQNFAKAKFSTGARIGC